MACGLVVTTVAMLDLTHPISSNMPVYPGTNPPVFTTECSIDDTGFRETRMTLCSHTGTHVDAPAHLIKGANTLDLLPIEHFHGPAFLLNCANTRSHTIGIEELEPDQDTIRQVAFLLIHTGWSQHWGTDKYFAGYPVLSLEAAEWLGRFGLRGLGVDTISVDEADAQDFLVHKALLRNDTIIIENLTNLERLPRDQFILSCFPLSFADADGSPVRAVALIQ